MKYIVSTGAVVFVHKTEIVKKEQILRAIPQHFEAIVVTRSVVYTEDDIILSPDSREICRDEALEYGLQNSMYFHDKEYYGFRLPQNSKGAAFMLVPKKMVFLVADLETEARPGTDPIIQKFNSRINEVIDELLPKSLRGNYQLKMNFSEEEST
jgi:hypothetical protein